MASPFCAICEMWGDSEEVLCCEEFPLGASKTRYPWGCNDFKAKPGMEEISRRWTALQAHNADLVRYALKNGLTK